MFIMLKKHLLVSSTLLLCIIALFNTSKITVKAESIPTPVGNSNTISCCTYTSTSDAGSSRQSQFNDASSISCTLVKTEKDCFDKRKSTYTFRGRSAPPLTTLTNAYVVPSCTNYCQNKTELFTKVIYRNSCCVPSDKKKPCNPVGAEITGCSVQGYSLVKQTCSTIDSCKQYGTVTSSPSRNDKELDAYVSQSIQQNQVMPYLSVPIPGLQLSNITLSEKDAAGKRYITIPWLAQYIERLYSYAIGIAGIVATVMLMVGGFTWTVSAGEAGRIQSAKDTIKSAILGLVLVMSSYMILNFVNPSLVALQSLQIELPELRQDPDRDITLFQECDYTYINKAFKKELVKTTSGQMYCPSYNKLQNLYPTLDSSIFSGGQRLKVDQNVLTGLKAIQDKMKQYPQNYGHLKFTLGNRSQTLQAQSSICQSSLQKRRTADAKVKAEPQDMPDCKTNKHLNGKQVFVLVNSTKMNCGAASETQDCRISTNGTAGITDKINNKTCTREISNCQDYIENLFKNVGKFTSDPKKWWVFTK